jgi:hypothetical protein
VLNPERRFHSHFAGGFIGDLLEWVAGIARRN